MALGYSGTATIPRSGTSRDVQVITVTTTDSEVLAPIRSLMPRSTSGSYDVPSAWISCLVDRIAGLPVVDEAHGTVIASHNRHSLRNIRVRGFAF